MIRQTNSQRFILACLAVATLWISATPAGAIWSTQWQLGAPGRYWPVDGVGGGPDVDFVQESGSSNPLPGDPYSPSVHMLADDDYYFAGTYPFPINTVASDEIAMERAFLVTDNTLRIHFNLLPALNSADLLRFSFEPISLDMSPNNFDPRYGVEVYFNSVLIMPELVIRPAELNTVFTTAEFTAADVGAIGGAGGDNIIELRGSDYNSAGGGTWMGLDFYQLEIDPQIDITPIPEPSSLVLLLVAGALYLPKGCRAMASKIMTRNSF